MSEYQIVCRGCGYNEFVQKGDYSKWRSLGEKFLELSNEEITQDEFMTFAKELHLRELVEIMVWGTTWECGCGESNPPNFSECWKCNAPSPVDTLEVKEKDIHLGEGFPWGIR